MPPRLRVALDVTPVLGVVTGVGRMVEQVLPRLQGRDDLELVAFAMTWQHRNDLAEHVPAGVRVTTRPLPARPAREAWKRLDLPPLRWWTGPVDVVHGTNFVVPPSRPAAEVATVHDLTGVRYPELCTRDGRAFPALVRRALRRGAWIHTVSHAVAAEVVADYGAPEDRVVVVPNGVTPPTGGDPADGRRLAGSERYVLALGTIEPRKDVPTLVEAFARLEGHDDVRLVLAGHDGWGAEAVDEAVRRTGVGPRVTRLGWTPEHDRTSLLRGATVLAFPSVYEGFGLPPLEAMAVDTPVVTTTVPAIEEVVGDAAVLVPPADPDGLAEALTRILDDEALRAELVAKGHRRVAAYPWSATADGLAHLYHRAAG
jgi:glycosyltransferase involved in cell wall biosynthesis